MKIKISKKWFSLILILSYFGSLFALGSFRFPKTGKMVSLPEKNIIDYELPERTKNYLLTKGFTIVKLEYSWNCENCLEIKNFLEEKALANKNQMILEEIISNVTLAKVEILSPNGEESFVNSTKDELQKAICELFVSPPIECALEEIS